MHISTVKDMLDECSFFKGLSAENLCTIAGCAGNQRFRRGEFLFREGTPANYFYLIKSGTVTIESPAALGQLTIQNRTQGDIVGFSWLLPPYTWKFSALAIEDVSSIRFDASCIRNKCKQDHDLGYELMTRVALTVAESLEAAREQLSGYL